MPDDEQILRAMITDWTRALEARDLARLTSNYDPDVVLYDVKFTVRGIADYRALWAQCFPMFPEKFRLERAEEKLIVSGDVAIYHGLTAIVPGDAPATAERQWLRVTVGYRKVAGQWLVVHEHVSVPFDFESMQPSFMGNDYPPA